MKHIIIPLSDSLGAGYDYLAAVPSSEKKQYGFILPSENPKPALVQKGNDDVCWKYTACMTDSSAKEILRAVVEQLRADIDPLGGDSFTVDVIVDASHAETAEKVLPELRKAGQWYRIHVIFLSEKNSDYGKEQASFFTKIRNDASGKHDDSGLGWTWFTMLADENSNGAQSAAIRKQREELLPFLLRDEHLNDTVHSCYTYAVSYKVIRFDQIPEIPRIQTTRFVCEAIQAREVFNELGLLLMNGDVCPDRPDQQMSILKKNLLGCVDLREITGQDLLIRKQDPQADLQTRDALDKLLRDNPDRDARRYDRAVTEEQLRGLPAVQKAVEAWEEYVLSQAGKHTDLVKIRNQFTNESDWMTSISKDFQSGYYHDDPVQMCTSTLRGKDGFENQASDSAKNDLERTNQQLRNAFFQACLRLLVFQARHTYTKIDGIIQSRRTAVQEMLRSAEGYEDTERMTRNWCEKIRGKLTETAAAIPLYTESADDPKQLLEKYAATLMDHIRNQVQISDGYDEMSSPENADSLMRTIRETTTPYQLVNPALTGSASRKREEKWYVCDQLRPTYERERIQQTGKQIVLYSISYYLYPAADTAPDPERGDYTDILFRSTPFIWTNIQNRSGAQAEKPEQKERQDSGEEDDETGKGDSALRFNWEYPEADMVNIRYYLFGSTEPELSVRKSKPDFSGRFVVQPPASLPSGARIVIEIGFLKGGHEIGRYSRTIHYETEKVRLTAEEETYPVKAGLFKKTWYHRLRIRNASGLTGKLAIRNAMSGCICYDVIWNQDGRDSVSGPLPEGGAWCLANRPDSPYVYELNQ